MSQFIGHEYMYNVRFTQDIIYTDDCKQGFILQLFRGLPSKTADYMLWYLYFNYF